MCLCALPRALLLGQALQHADAGKGQNCGGHEGQFLPHTEIAHDCKSLVLRDIPPYCTLLHAWHVRCNDKPEGCPTLRRGPQCAFDVDG